MASFALRAGALYWAPNYISKFSFLDNINNQWLKLTKKSHCKFYFRRRTLTLSFYYDDIICRDWCNPWPSYKLYTITLAIHFSLFPACFYERCIWEALSVEVIHEHLVVFTNKSVKNLFRVTARSLAVFTINYYNTRSKHPREHCYSKLCRECMKLHLL